MTYKKKYIVIDLDGTILRTDPDRLMYEHSDPPNWDAYHELHAYKDTALEEVRGLINDLDVSFEEMLFVTSRQRKNSSEVFAFVRNAFYYGRRRPKILMRPNDNNTPCEVLKPELLRYYLGEDWADQVRLVLDDKPEVCHAFRNAGVVALQVHDPVQHANIEKVKLKVKETVCQQEQ